MLRLGLAAVVVLSGAAVEASTDLRPAVTTRGSYGESFTFAVDLEDGGYLQLSFGLTNIGPGSLKAICRAIVAPPGAAVWRASTRTGRDGWSWSDSRGDERLAIGPCSTSLEGDVTAVDVALEGGAVRLRLAGRATRQVPADAAFGVGDDFYRSEVLLYRVRAEGTIQLPGGTPRRVAGGAYLDHTRSTIPPRSLAERWVRFRALRAERGMMVLARRGHDGRFTPVWACEAPGHCRHFPSFSVERSGAAPSPAFRIDFPSDRDPLKLSSGQLLYRDDPMSELGVLGTIAAPFFGAPITYVYRGRLTGAGADPIDGILEVELSAE